MIDLRLIDLSHPIHTGMPVYPGDDPTCLEQTRHLEPDKHVNHRLEISMHSGTHLDGPAHLLPRPTRVLDLPLDRCQGKGCLLDVRGQPLIRWDDRYRTLIGDAEVVLLYTGWDSCFGEDRYFLQHPVVDVDFAAALLELSVKILGVDLPSPDQPPFPVHKLLLGEQVLILENLTNLQALLAAERFSVLTFPLPLAADSSPVRAVACLY